MQLNVIWDPSSCWLYGSGAPLAWDLVAVDVNGDGKPDLAVGNGSGAIGLLTGRGDGTFEPAQTYPVPGINTSITAADLNRDNAVDLVVTNGNRSVSVLLNSAPCNGAPPVNTVSADPASLWPSTGKPVAVTVSGSITASNCTPGLLTATYTVRDEYGAVAPSGPITVGADGRFSFAVRLPASRRGNDPDGRLFTIVIDVRTADGATATTTTAVVVPHDQRR